MEPLAEISVDDLAARLDAADAGEAGRVTVIDVRQPDEYRAGHVRAARLIPLHEIPDHVAELAELAELAAGDGDGDGGPLYLICRSGSRSAMAGEFLQEQGIPAVNVAGGTLAWVEAGHDVVPGDQPA